MKLPQERQAAISWYTEILTRAEKKGQEVYREAKRQLLINDLFYLLVAGLGRKDANNDWLFARCREVQAEPNNRLDLWAREHYKSTIITFALTIQDILRDPETTIGIFSHTRPIAKGFLRQIKREFEGNEVLRDLFPDIIWDNPQKDAPKWSEDDGIIVKRKGNPKEATIEAYGLVDGQPTSKHFKCMVYDDVVTRESVTSPDMIHKVTEAWELSRNLGSEGGSTRYIGTRYHFNDTYKTIMERGVKARVYPATQNGDIEGEPCLLSRERLAEKRREMGPYTFGCQMMQDPKADETQGFKFEWVRYYQNHHGADEMNRYILVDPASEKKANSDYTALWVIGLSPDKNYYILDMIRDRLNLTQRADLVFRMHRKWKPNGVGYEKYGMMADVEYLKDRMEQENYNFQVTELGGSMPKNDRIRRLIPFFEQGRMFFPEVMLKTNYEGVTQDLIDIFFEEEYKAFPVALHDDMLDALARILDDKLNASWPYVEDDDQGDRYERAKRRNKARSWMTA